MKKSNKLFGSILAGCLILSAGGCGNSSSSAFRPEYKEGYANYEDSLRIEDTRNLSDCDYSVFNTVATDDFGRMFVTVDGVNEEKYVGMFFFLTLGQHDNHTGIYDVNVITKGGTDENAFQSDNRNSPLGATHFWGEPVWGYYNACDPWVMRKQIELLTMAGVDFLVFDTTNGFTYKQVTDVLFEILQEYHDAGWKVPKFMYYTAAETVSGQNKATIAEIYNNYYKDGKYKDLWFCPYEDGKPIITRHESNEYAAGDPIGEFFHFRYRQWPNEAYREYSVPWMEFTNPQPNHAGWMNVSVAQHSVTIKMSDLAANPGRGASFYNEDGMSYFINDSENFQQGANYESQWDYVLKNKEDVDFTFVTGWNEWVAIKQLMNGQYITCDCYNPEYSRDIEPTRVAGIGDNFYLQTVRKMREYKGAEAKHYRYADQTIDIEKDDSAWENVQTYLDFTGECQDRDFKTAVFGTPRKNLVNKTGRNDIESIKVAKDKEYLYFRITATEELTERDVSDTDWMNIWISTENGGGDMLNGYNYVINRQTDGGKTSVFRTKGENNFLKSGEGELRVYGRTMIVRIPLESVQLSANDYAFSFKVTDNVNFEKDYMNLYDTGDAAPCGRLNFSYGH